MPGQVKLFSINVLLSNDSLFDILKVKSDREEFI